MHGESSRWELNQRNKNENLVTAADDQLQSVIIKEDKAAAAVFCCI